MAMETLASYLYYGYVATILFIVNIIFLSFARKDIIKPIVAIGIIAFIILLANLVVYNPIKQLDWIWYVEYPSYREVAINIILVVFLLFLLKKILGKGLFIIFLLLWCGLVVDLFFLIETYHSVLYYSIVVDAFGLLVTLAITFEMTKTNKYIMLIIYHIFCPILSLFIILFWLPVKTHFPIFPSDLRGNEIVCIFNSDKFEYRNPQDVVCELHNTIDKEKRFIKIIDFVKNSKKNVNYKFIEDTLAALNFYRSTYIIHEDSIFPRDAYPKLTINYHNSRFKDNFEYRTEATSFQIESSDKGCVQIKGDFTDLTLKRFCALQQYLKQEIPDLTNLRISLYNNSNDFKLGIQYFENDEYCLYFDDSFLDK